MWMITAMLMLNFSRLGLARLGGYEDGADDGDVNDVNDGGCWHPGWDNAINVGLGTVDARCSV